MEFNENKGQEKPEAAGGPAGIGAVLRATRIAKGLSLFVLAHELNLSVQILEAVEQEAWDRLPPGRERPHTRQIAERLGVDLASFQEQWNQLPGALAEEPRNQRREALERVLVSAITVGSLGLLFWLVVPGPSLKPSPKPAGPKETAAAPAPWVPKDPAGPFPVLGEVLPEVPVNQDGVLVALRALDTCEAVITDAGGAQQKHTLRVSEPWRVRVKGPFSIALDNAGVVALEVAGHRIRHGRNVGEAWEGQFGPDGDWIVPRELPPEYPSTAPETDPATESDNQTQTE
jgi:transcriptional regulator with XRE-family HTH domain